MTRMVVLPAPMMTHPARRREPCQHCAMPAPHFAHMDWPRWKPVEDCSLVFIVDGARVLLIRKKRGLGKGKWNGPGGRLEAGETPAACGVREVREEVGLRVTALEAAGTLRFQFVDGYATRVHVFRSAHFEGTASETEEAAPLWMQIAAVPYEEMWQDDRYWLPLLFEGIPFEGNFLLDGDELLAFDLDRR